MTVLLVFEKMVFCVLCFRVLFVFASKFVGSFDRWFRSSFVPKFDRSEVRSFVPKFVRSFRSSFVRSEVRSFVPKFRSSFVRSEVRSFVPKFVRSFGNVDVVAVVVVVVAHKLILILFQAMFHKLILIRKLPILPSILSCRRWLLPRPLIHCPLYWRTVLCFVVPAVLPLA